MNKYVVFRMKYSSEEKMGEFDNVKDAETFAKLLYMGNGQTIRVWITGIIKIFENRAE